MRAALLVLPALLVAACDSAVPTATETVCPSPDPNTLTYENFGMKFMTDYCISCHDKKLPRSQRNGAPLYHDFDTLLGVLQVSNHIDEQSGSGPAAENHFMPPERCPSVAGGALDRDCPQPTADERRDLAIWVACEVDRPHAF